MNWYLNTLKNKYADFDGRARRTEYWMFMLFHFIILFILVFLSALIARFAMINILIVILPIYVLATFIPALAVTIRRLHDTGKSGWYYLLSFIPYVGGLILLFFTLQDSEPMQNKWGHNPKNISYEEINEIGKPADF